MAGKISLKTVIITLSSLLPLYEAVNVPYQASLEYNGNYLCGATILSLSTFVTAAHCVQGKDTKDFVVRGGNLKQGQGGKTVQVKEFRIHPNYNNETLDYDLAVIVPQTFFPDHGIVTEYIEGIKIADANENIEGQNAMTSGWGDDDDFNQVLVYLELPILARKVCDEHLKMTDRMICAGYLEGGKGMSDEDAGSPLVVNKKLVGIASKGGYAKPNKADLFTDVRVLKSWIEANTQN